MNARLGWALAALAAALGLALHGWRGMLLVVSVAVFWLLLQASRALRAMRAAAGAPVGTVASAVMLNAALQPGLPLTELLLRTRSLGRRTAGQPETYAWTDAGGATVSVELARGRVARWTLSRADDATPDAAGGEAPRA